MSPGREPGPQGSGEWNANDWPGELVNRAIHRLPAEIGGDLGEDGIGEEALFVGLVVERLEFFARDFDAFGEGGLGIEFDAGEDRFPVWAFFKESDRVVGVGFEGEVLEGAEREEGEHMAAGQGSDKSLFGVHAIFTAKIFGCS